MKKVLVLGKGKSGLAARHLLENDGFLVTMVDDQDLCFEERELSSFCFVVTSPGFSPTNKWTCVCKNAGLRILSELDLGLLHLETPNVIAVTGTNGKTTCTMLLKALLGQNSFALGNVGTPLCEKVGEICKQANVVLEVSSFMLFQSEKLSPKIAILTNISPDHKEWHGSFEAYRKSKLKIFEGQQKEAHAILCADDEDFERLRKSVVCNLWCISLERRVKGCFVNQENIIFWDGHIYETVAKLEDVHLAGRHNLKNVLMCVLAAKLCGVKNDAIANRLKNFVGLPHRLALVLSINGVDFVNDSKSTNTDSTLVACKTFLKPITLLVGGYDKGICALEMFEALNGLVDSVVAFGECGPKFFCEARHAGLKKVFLKNRLSDAFEFATKITKQGGVVLLSPATSSFDEFVDYKQRGEAFEQLVKDFEQNQAKAFANKTF